MARADDETLQLLVGQPAVKLLNLLDPRLARPSQLRDVCLGLHNPEDLLRDSGSRALLIDLLRYPDALELASLLGLSRGDPFEMLKQNKPTKGAAAEKDVFDYLGVVPEEQKAPEPARPISPIDPAYGLFDHQRRAYRDVFRHLGTAPRRTVLHMPTGSGKTRTAHHVVATVLRQSEPTLVVWLAYSEELCEQAASEFELAWSSVGDRTTNIYRFWGQHDLEIDDLRDGFLVAGLGKTFARAKRDANFISRLADRTSMVVIDEAHQAIAETYRFVLEFLVERSADSQLLGLTATPGRSWNDRIADSELSDFFARKKITLEVAGYASPVEYLIDEGYLARPAFVPITYESDQELSEIDLEELADSLDVPQRILAMLASDEQRNLLIIKRVEDLLRRHERILVFAATVGHARLIATVLQARGHDAAAVTGITAQSERQRVVNRFRSNADRSMVLCNYGVLTAGFDAPRTSAAVIARPTKSLVLYSQMVGRATRGPRAGGNSDAEILTVVDTQLPGFGDMSEAFNNWEDVWDEPGII